MKNTSHLTSQNDTNDCTLLKETPFVLFSTAEEAKGDTNEDNDDNQKFNIIHRKCPDKIVVSRRVAKYFF
jgi:hypothetical protein